MPPVYSTDIMAGITALLTGLQANMDRGKTEELKALQLMAGMPGMQLTPATDAQPASIFKRLLGLPAYQQGPGGMPVAQVGSSAMTVKKGRTTQDFINQLLGGSEEETTLDAPGYLPTTTAGAGGVSPGLPSARGGRLAAAGGAVSREEMMAAMADPKVRALLGAKDDQSGAVADRIIAIRKEKADRDKERQVAQQARVKNEKESAELIGQYYASAKDQVSLDTVNEALERILPPEQSARLLRTYNQGAIDAVVRRALSVSDLTATDRAVATERAVGPERNKTALDLQRAGRGGRIDEAVERQVRVGDVETQQQQERLIQGETIRSRSVQQVEEPKRRFAAEDKLRDEFTTVTKTYREVVDAYGRVIAAKNDPSAAGDLALVYAYMKILDPGSVVREGEFATAQNAGGVGDRIIAQYNKILSGERLAPDVRTDFVDRATRLYDQHTSDYTNIRTQYRGIAERNQVNPENVTLDYRSTAPRGQPAPGTQPPAKIGPSPAASVSPATKAAPFSTTDVNKAMAVENAARATPGHPRYGKPPVSREQVIEMLTEQGLQVR